ncbi:MAG: family 16 glycosylhydrolase [Bacteroidales bacterium]|nr:family 16 glycosylhydrolase [Bacteroidales bacterium]
MRMFSVISAALVVCCACAGPAETPAFQGTLSFGPSELVFGYEEGETVVTVESDCEWGAAVSDPSWCTIFPGGGVAGKTEVKVKVQKNLFAEERENCITFRYGRESAVLPVVQTPSSDGPQMFVPEGYKLFWSDEFEGNSLNTDNWTAETGAGGWGNAELQYYTDRTENVAVRDGKLVITARRENYNGAPVTSARLITLDKVKFLYGYVVASIKLPKTANGLWPAFWMMGNDIRTNPWPNCGETDILEMGHANGIAAGTQEKFLNGACHWGVPGHQYYAHDITNSYSVQDGKFHTFTCIWDEDYIRMYIDLETYPDAKPYFEMKIVDFGDNEFRKENFILLNLAVGGNFPAIWDIGQVTALRDGEAAMEVDYVRVFQKK